MTAANVRIVSLEALYREEEYQIINELYDWGFIIDGQLESPDKDMELIFRNRLFQILLTKMDARIPCSLEVNLDAEGVEMRAVGQDFVLFHHTETDPDKEFFALAQEDEDPEKFYSKVVRQCNSLLNGRILQLDVPPLKDIKIISTQTFQNDIKQEIIDQWLSRKRLTQKAKNRLLEKYQIVLPKELKASYLKTCI